MVVVGSESRRLAVGNLWRLVSQVYSIMLEE